MNRWFLVNVVGEDHPGIAAQVSSVLSAAGMNVVNIGSDVDGTGEKPVYIMIINGYAEGGMQKMARTPEPVRLTGIEVRLSAIGAHRG